MAGRACFDENSWERKRAKRYSHCVEGSIPTALSRVGAGGRRPHFLQMLRSAAYGWDILCVEARPRKFCKSCHRTLEKKKKQERGLRVKFMSLRVKILPVCVFVTAILLLHEVTEATASQGLGLEPDHVCPVVHWERTLMLVLMCPCTLHSGVHRFATNLWNAK